VQQVDDLCGSEIDDYTITTLTIAVKHLNCKRTKITELYERIITLITDPDELTDTMINAGEFEDSIVENISKVNRFIELNKNTVKPQTLIDKPHHSTINRDGSTTIKSTYSVYELSLSHYAITGG